ncbi:hypothetical protein [Streptomyces sp. NRRL S-37]|uniref:hypothetical protein n=1 Tax=Streptomyces sp. NRRL S-37 TaxID=1463903 RepID=UPI0004C55621|nr:hypothetical protein [Streptomyces sp. NRRL S-37]
MSRAAARIGVGTRCWRTVPAERCTQLHLDEHRFLRQIVALTGFSRGLLTDLAEEYGIPLRAGLQDDEHRGTIDRAWLIGQYVVHRRTLPGLAQEEGTSPAAMARWAHNRTCRTWPRDEIRPVRQERCRSGAKARIRKVAMAVPAESSDTMPRLPDLRAGRLPRCLPGRA